MTKHTPGPWKILKVADSLGIIPAKRPPGVKRSSDVEDIASVDLANEQHDGQANARLIAAAPDLLAVCEAALRHLQPEVEDEVYEEREGRASTLHDQLLTAIAKAKGRE